MLGYTPANQNISFNSLTRNPLRQKAEAKLAQTLHDLELDDVSPSLLADVLFELSMIEMEPDVPISSESAITWFSQLQRFRDRLESKIQYIEQIYENVPG